MASPRHFNIVALETFFSPLPKISVPKPHTFTLTEHNRTTVAEIPDRIKDADILITTTIPVRAEHLSKEISPNLKLISVQASGTDSVDLDVCRQRGIRVLNSPGCNVDAVAEHAVGLYFATRRSIVPTMKATREGEWPRQGNLMRMTFSNGQSPRSCHGETAVIIGYGGVGRRIESIFTSLGMKVLISGRKNASSGAASGRVEFEKGIREATVLVLCCPRTEETVGMISGPEFEKMRPDALVINVARGGIVVEEELLKALESGKIAGAATDVYDQEPASPESSVLLGADAGLNLVTTPHTAWIGMDTMVNYQRVVLENINGYISGQVSEERIKA